MSIARKSLLLVCLLILAIGVFVVFQRIPSSNDEAINQFLRANVAEDQLIDALILRGRGVVPLLVTKVLDKNMPRRRYAISALGNLGSTDAIPVLTSIYKDPDEVGYFRCDALSSIAQIDFEHAKRLANQAADIDVDCLRKLHDELEKLNRDDFISSAPFRRSYFDALVGRHE